MSDSYQLVNKRFSKNKTLADILGKMEELQKELILNNTSLSECTEQLKDATKKLIFEQKKSEFLEVRGSLASQSPLSDGDQELPYRPAEHREL